jgi:hypothetical protein
MVKPGHSGQHRVESVSPQAILATQTAGSTVVSQHQQNAILAEQAILAKWQAITDCKEWTMPQWIFNGKHFNRSPSQRSFENAIAEQDIGSEISIPAHLVKVGLASGVLGLLIQPFETFTPKLC